jgi:hypothetical protein
MSRGLGKKVGFAADGPKQADCNVIRGSCLSEGALDHAAASAGLLGTERSFDFPALVIS